MPNHAIHRSALLTLLLTLCLALTGCSGDEVGSTNTSDTGTDVGAGVDGDVLDAGGADAAIGDTASADATTAAADVSVGDAVDAVAGDAAGDAGTGCTPAKCAKGAPLVSCHEWTCDAAGQCKDSVAADATKCDDGDDCTLVSKCTAGKCQGTESKCACAPGMVDKCWDELGLGVTNLCLGVPFCEAYTDNNQNLFRCAVKPGSAVVCPTTGDTVCEKNVCSAPTGKCGMSPVVAGTACEDGIKCTLLDGCKDGKCAAGVDACWCTPEKGVAKCFGGGQGQLDINPDDKCAGVASCKSTTDAVTKQIDYTCELDKATIVTCSKALDTECLKSTCDANQGICTLKASSKPIFCDDGDSCTANDTCDAGVCVGPVSLCTCKKDADCAGSEDGDACNGTLICDTTKGKCVDKPGSTVTCVDTKGGVCLTDYCDPKTGACKVAPAEQFVTYFIFKQVLDPQSGAVTLIKDGVKTVFMGAKQKEVYCSDGDACTVNETCEGGKCKTGSQKVCTCAKDADCAAVEDGNPCTGTLMCVKGACLTNPTSVPPPCKGPTAGTCLADVCDPKSGKCAAMTNTAICDDANPCTADACGSDEKTCEATPMAKGTPCFGQVCNETGACVVKKK